MAKLLKLRGGTTTEHSSFTGEERELTIDTTKDTAVVHDGTTAGGHPLQKELGTGDITSDLIADNNVTADELNVSGDGTSGQVLTSDGDGSMSWSTLSSESLTKDMTVATGGSVTAGKFVNNLNGEIGIDPVANDVTASNNMPYGDDWGQGGVSSSTGPFTKNGKYYVMPVNGSFLSSSLQYKVGTIDDTTGSYNLSSAVTVNGSFGSGSDGGKGYILATGDIDRKYLAFSGYKYTGGSSTNTTSKLFFGEIDPTNGTVTTNPSNTQEVNANGIYQRTAMSVSHTDRSGRAYWRKYYSDLNSPYNSTKYDYYSSNIPSTGGSISAKSLGYYQPGNGNYYHTPWQSWNFAVGTGNSGSYDIGVNESGSYQQWTYNTTNHDIGSPTSSTKIFSDIANSEFRIARLSSSADEFAMLYKDNAGAVVIALATYDASTDTWTKDDSLEIYSADATNSCGDVAVDYSNNKMVVGWYSNGIGYLQSFTIDNMAITGTGLLLTENNSGTIPYPKGPHGTDKYSVVNIENSNADTFNSTVFTANSYDSPQLNWAGVASESGTAGDTVGVYINGIASGFTGLTPGSKYYYDTTTYDGSVTTTANDQYVGTAISATEIQLATIKA